MKPLIVTHHLSRWYGNVLGLSDVSLEIGPGITGLLGPNGAGKSTLLKLITGQIRPSLGQVFIDGQPVKGRAELFFRLGYCPEQDAFFESLTGWQFLYWLLRLHHFSEKKAAERTEEMLNLVELGADGHRPIRSYSRGMRQRLKLAQALAHQPEILILDEPLNGLDPLGKRKMIRLIRDFGREGHLVIVSSHILPEIEALTKQIILIHQGKVFAQGEIHEIRDLIERHPHIVSIKTPNSRRLAALLIEKPYVVKAYFGEKETNLFVETRDRDKFFEFLLEKVVNGEIEVEEITSPDDNLQAVFDYLVGKP
ncbi:MAG: ABC transporter ATP-binding protein [Candidatus Aminicenantes bacterium]|nr:ABC transporter ATP-binding protein [Candidatus Aminicenantes bacterium]